MMASLEMNIKQVNADFQSIKEKIVASGVEVANGTKTADYAQKVTEVYEAGKKAEYDAFWDAVQQNGNLKNYTCTFSGKGWNNQVFKPKYDIRPTASSSQCFYYTGIQGDLAEILSNCGVVADFSKTTSLNGAFNTTLLTRIGLVDARNISSATGVYQIFIGSTKLETIDKLILKDDGSQKFSDTFTNCSALKNVIFEGVIGQNGLSFKDCPLLSKASIESVIGCLSTTTSGLTVTFSKTAKESAFTADEWAALIATRPNWTISLV